MLLISLFTMVLEFPTSFMFLCKIGQERIQKYTESRLRYWVHRVQKQGNKAISVQRQHDNLFRKSRDLPGGAEVRRPHSQRRGPGFPPWSENETPPATIKGLHLQGRSKALSAAVRPSVCVLNCLIRVRLYDSMDRSLPGCSVHGILQARIVE